MFFSFVSHCFPLHSSHWPILFCPLHIEHLCVCSSPLPCLPCSPCSYHLSTSSLFITVQFRCHCPFPSHLHRIPCLPQKRLEIIITGPWMPLFFSVPPLGDRLCTKPLNALPLESDIQVWAPSLPFTSCMTFPKLFTARSHFLICETEIIAVPLS